MTINEEELQPLLQEKKLSFQKASSDKESRSSLEKLRQEQAKAALFQKIAEDGRRNQRGILKGAIFYEADFRTYL